MFDIFRGIRRPRSVHGLFLTNQYRKFQAVIIAKNACTTLKTVVLQDDYGGDLEGASCVHDYFGYTDTHPSIELIHASRRPGIVRFAVFRDPIERVISVYRNKLADPATNERAGMPFYRRRGLIGCDFDTFFDFLITEFRNTAREKLESHIRPQALQFDPTTHIDWLVHLRDLDSFLANEFRLATPVRRNEARGPKPELTRTQHRELRRLYRWDYRLPVLAPRIYSPGCGSARGKAA